MSWARHGSPSFLGDSIFDNAVYVSGGPDVVRQARDIIPAGWRATLLAFARGEVEGRVWIIAAPEPD